MNEAERLLESLREGHTLLMNVPLGTDVAMAENQVRQFGHDHGMDLSIVRMLTEEDKKLAIGPGISRGEPST